MFNFSTLLVFTALAAMNSVNALAPRGNYPPPHTTSKTSVGYPHTTSTKHTSSTKGHYTTVKTTTTKGYPHTTSTKHTSTTKGYPHTTSTKHTSTTKGHSTTHKPTSTVHTTSKHTTTPECTTTSSVYTHSTHSSTPVSTPVSTPPSSSSSSTVSSTVSSTDSSSTVSSSTVSSSTVSSTVSSSTAGPTPSGCPAPPPLGTASNFVILAETGVSNVPASLITGDLGISPSPGTGYTGFANLLAPSGQSSTSAQVVGRLFAADNSDPTPATLTTAISDMQAAYTDVAGRPNPLFVELGGGLIGGRTLTGGIYKWSTGVSIAADITLQGGACNIFIFQIAGTFTMAANTRIILAGGVLPSQVFFAVADAVTIGAAAQFQGTLLGQTGITLETGASANGHLFSQSLVALQQSVVTIA